jgi:ribosomal protein S18 acetylase RimI-like enzyme
MAVEPSHARRGIGRALLDAVEALARERGIPHLSLMVTDENAAARALYDRAGFATERRLLTKAL